MIASDYLIRPADRDGNAPAATSGGQPPAEGVYLIDLLVAAGRPTSTEDSGADR